MKRPGKLLAHPLQLWDVRDVEAHCRVLLDARLDDFTATLDYSRYDDALTYLLTKCWELSGLEADGVTRRLVWWAFAYELEEVDAGDDGEQKAWFRSEALARARADLWMLDGLVVVVEQRAPAGAYDPERGLAFSTYSRRVLGSRVVDWYRSTFGDSRYDSGARRETSYEALLEADGTRTPIALEPAFTDTGYETAELRVALGL